VGVDFGPGDVVARGNFATLDADGRVSDRRAGRLSTEESRRIVAGLDRALEAARGEGRLGDLRVTVHPGEGYRFVLLVEGPDLSPAIADTDPQEVGERPISLEPSDPEDPRARRTVERLEPALRAMAEALRGEPRANGFLLRGFATLPRLPTLPELYGLAPGCFAGYPLYRGASRLAGMEVVDSGKAFGEQVEGVRSRWRDFDFFFLHVKDTDRAGEDGDLAAKARALEEVDGVLPGLLALMDEERDVIAVTGDHSTPAPMRLHSWHPVPLLLRGPFCFVDDETAFTEVAASRGHLGTLLSRELMGLLLANAGRLAKFGA
jgi:2,3-bisphosphoglycerate-independent phosphoglycerate mutase